MMVTLSNPEFHCPLNQNLILNSLGGVPGWLSQLSIQLLISAQVMISKFMESSPKSGPMPDSKAWSLLCEACLGFSLSFSLCPSRTHTGALSQNKTK